MEVHMQSALALAEQLFSSNVAARQSKRVCVDANGRPYELLDDRDSPVDEQLVSCCGHVEICIHQR